MQLSNGFLKIIVYISIGDFGLELCIILEMSEFIFLNPVKKNKEMITIKITLNDKRNFFLGV